MHERHTLEVCFNCKHWSVEPGALDPEHIKKAKGDTGSYDQIPVAYGKCEVMSPKLGTLSQSRCQVRDESGEPMFEPVPEG